MKYYTEKHDLIYRGLIERILEVRSMIEEGSSIGLNESLNRLRTYVKTSPTYIVSRPAFLLGDNLSTPRSMHEVMASLTFQHSADKESLFLEDLMYVPATDLLSQSVETFPMTWSISNGLRIITPASSPTLGTTNIDLELVRNNFHEEHRQILLAENDNDLLLDLVSEFTVDHFKDRSSHVFPYMILERQDGYLIRIDEEYIIRVNLQKQTMNYTNTFIGGELNSEFKDFILGTNILSN